MRGSTYPASRLSFSSFHSPKWHKSAHEPESTREVQLQRGFCFVYGKKKSDFSRSFLAIFAFQLRSSRNLQPVPEWLVNKGGGQTDPSLSCSTGIKLGTSLARLFSRGAVLRVFINFLKLCHSGGAPRMLLVNVAASRADSNTKMGAF